MMLKPDKREIAPGRGKYWILFLLSTVLMFAMMYFPATRGWFWVVIPFVCTYITQAFDGM